MRLLDGGPVSAGAGAAAWALMELCHRNPAGQNALLSNGGVEKVRTLVVPSLIAWQPESFYICR